MIKSMTKIGIGIEVVHETSRSDAAVITVPARQGATVAVPKLEIEGIEAVQNCGETGVGLGAEGMTDVSEVAQGLNVTDLLLEATQDGESKAGHGLGLPDAIEAVRESRPTAETVVKTAAGTVESVHDLIRELIDEMEAAAVLIYALIDAIGAVPVLDDNAADPERVVAA